MKVTSDKGKADVRDVAELALSLGTAILLAAVGAAIAWMQDLQPSEAMAPWVAVGLPILYFVRRILTEREDDPRSGADSAKVKGDSPDDA